MRGWTSFEGGRSQLNRSPLATPAFRPSSPPLRPYPVQRRMILMRLSRGNGALMRWCAHLKLTAHSRVPAAVDIDPMLLPPAPIWPVPVLRDRPPLDPAGGLGTGLARSRPSSNGATKMLSCGVAIDDVNIPSIEPAVGWSLPARAPPQRWPDGPADPPPITTEGRRVRGIGQLYRHKLLVLCDRHRIANMRIWRRFRACRKPREGADVHRIVLRGNWPLLVSCDVVRVGACVLGNL